MLKQAVVLVCICISTIQGVDHPELRGEQPNKEDIDNGQCVPIPCVMGVPPKECTRLCALRHYIPICQPPADFCLCQRLVDGKIQLVSPDEVEDQPLDKSDSYPDESHTFMIYAVFLPLKNLFGEPSYTIEPSSEPYVNGVYESVNVHEGRLFWDFRYILTGLLLLMIGLVVYELVLCGFQIYKPKQNQTSTKEKEAMNV